MIYRVWYWLAGRLEVVNCGRDAGYAWRLMEGYFQTPSYYPWLEYLEEVDRDHRQSY